MNEDELRAARNLRLTRHACEFRHTHNWHLPPRCECGAEWVEFPGGRAGCETVGPQHEADGSPYRTPLDRELRQALRDWSEDA